MTRLAESAETASRFVGWRVVQVDVTDEADDLAAYNQPERALDPALIDQLAAFIAAEAR